MSMQHTANQRASNQLGAPRSLFALLALTLCAACQPSGDTSEPSPPNGGEAASAEEGEASLRAVDGSAMYYYAPNAWSYGWSEPAEGQDAIEERPESPAPFWIDAAPVTAAQYRACVTEGACEEFPEANYFARQHCTHLNYTRSEAPVNCVTRDEAAAYCEWTQRRLPTEVEWELAARGPSGALAPEEWSARPDRLDSDRSLGVARVSTGRDGWAGPRRFHGLGQVREWASGVFEPGEGTRIRFFGDNPPAPTRGVAWNQEADAPLMARAMTDPENRSPAIGFRCAVSDSDVEAATCTSGSCRPAPPELPTQAWGDRLSGPADDAAGARIDIPAGDIEIQLPRLVRGEDRRSFMPYRVAAFRIDRTPVTVAAMRACVLAGRCSEPKRYTQGPWCNYGQLDWDQHPVNCVSGHEAQAFCEWAGGRLPTEQEWIRATFGDGLRAWPWGSAPEPGRSNLRHADQQEEDPDGWPFTSPVGAFERDLSPFGLTDAGGNISEWVQDPISPWATPESPNQTEPTGIGLAIDADISEEFRVLGLSWSHQLEDDGREYTLMIRPDITGFRCAWDIEDGAD